jgi:hypothetical protein
MALASPRNVEIAKVLGVSDDTVSRDSAVAAPEVKERRKAKHSPKDKSENAASPQPMLLLKTHLAGIVRGEHHENTIRNRLADRGLRDL